MTRGDGCPRCPSPDDARAWIGRRLTLREPFDRFAAGTACIVMCVADFGDGPCLWVVTDDTRAEDVDQVATADVARRFRVETGSTARAA